LKQLLERKFGCPVLDLYSLNEAGPVAVGDSSTAGHVLLQHRMYVEILDTNDVRQPAGIRGEIALTGGFNAYLPLLRYRTGDFASLEMHAGEAVLIGLEGRPPVRFRTMAGERINNIEITHALQRFAIPQFTLHQNADGSLVIRIFGPCLNETEIPAVLLELFGPHQQLEIQHANIPSGKVIQYTSDLQDSAL